MKTHGEIIIDAIIRAAVLDRAIPKDGGHIFLWTANAPEQVEAALAESGWGLVQEHFKRNDATDYAIALNEVDETMTAEKTAEQVAFVFLQPMALFKLWLRAFLYKLRA